jgi:hypothetical protein
LKEAMDGARKRKHIDLGWNIKSISLKSKMRHLCNIYLKSRRYTSNFQGLPYTNAGALNPSTQSRGVGLFSPAHKSNDTIQVSKQKVMGKRKC